MMSNAVYNQQSEDISKSWSMHRELEQDRRSILRDINALEHSVDLVRKQQFKFEETSKKTNKDLEELIKGVDVMREIMSQPEIAQFINAENAPWSNAHSRTEIIEAIKNTAYTGHHPCSTAKMGADNDPMSVLDSNLKVRGIEGLRVCDASAMPTQITGNLYATIIAIAEKAADLILEKDPLPSQFSIKDY